MADPTSPSALGPLMLEVWRQALVEERESVVLADQAYRVSRSSRQGLRIVGFEFGGRTIEGIEQNPETGSQWAKLARSGQRIMQFRLGRSYLGNVCEGKLLRYPAWERLGFPP